MIYFSWLACYFACDRVAFSKSHVVDHVHIVSYRFSFCFTILYDMMRTHFSYYIYVDYELTLSITSICFGGKNNYLKKLQEKVKQY